MIVLETERLILRTLEVAEAAFMLELLTDAAFVEHIGDRGVRTLAAAEAYLEAGAIASHARHGYGLDLVVHKASGERLGICGLVKREALDDVDIGFAFLPPYRAQGYAREAAAAVLEHAHAVLGLHRVLAIVSPANAASIKLLERIGLKFQRMQRMSAEAEEIRLYAWQA